MSRLRGTASAKIPPGDGIERPAISAIIPVVTSPSPRRHNMAARRREKTMMLSIARLAGCVAAITVIGTGFAFAQDCPRGDLDKAYCDRNGDLVADAPTDPKQLVNPSTLIFAYTPVEDPALYSKVWDGFIKHAEKVTGKKVAFFPVQSNAAEIEAMRSGRLHIAGVSTGPTPIAVNCAGYRSEEHTSELQSRLHLV